MYPPPHDSPPFKRMHIHEDQIELGAQPRNWIAKHQTFASKEWLVSRVQYVNWIPDKRGSDKFLIYFHDSDGTKPLTIVVKIQVFGSNVLVYHAHVLRKK